MENPQKPTQSLEQKQETPEDYVVATFPVDIDPDNARRPLTVIRSGQDGEGVKYDRGWNPIGMLVVCGTDSEGGIGPIKLLMEAYKVVGTDIKTEFVPLEDIQGLNEDYIKYLYGKTPKEMIEEAKRIWQQEHPGSEWRRLLDAKDHPENSSNSSVGEQDGSGFERPSADEASPKIGSAAVNATGIEKPAKIDKVDANPADLAATEPAKKPVETGRVSISPSTLVMSKKVLESIGAVKVDDSVGSPAIKSAAVKELAKNLAVASAKELVVDSIKNPAVKLAKKPAEIDKVGTNPADLVAIEPVKKLVEVDKTSADLADLSAAKSVENPVAEKSMETNETSAGILPESFKSVINNFEEYTGGDNGEFSAETKSIARELNDLKWRIQRNPEAIKESATEGLIQRASSRIRELEASRADSTATFKNNIDSLLKGLKSEIKNDNELKRLVELTKHVDQMGVDNKVLGDLTNVLLNKLTIIRRIIDDSRNDRWGIIAYRDHFVRVIGEIIGSDDYRDIDRKFSGDLGSVYRRRQSILDAIKGIRETGY